MNTFSCLGGGNLQVDFDDESTFVYKTNHSKRGLALIFNHEQYDPKLGLKQRCGTSNDRNRLAKILRESFGFKVQLYDDLTYQKMEKVIKRAGKKNHVDRDCILIVILTHGDRHWLFARDRQYQLDWLWPILDVDNCPSLAGKPKLFLVQVSQSSPDMFDLEQTCPYLP